MDQLELKLTIGAADPGDAAIRYGQANALLGSIWQPLTEAFHVEEGRARVEVDFTAAAPVLTGQVSRSRSCISSYGWGCTSACGP